MTVVMTEAAREFVGAATFEASLADPSARHVRRSRFSAGRAHRTGPSRRSNVRCAGHREFSGESRVGHGRRFAEHAVSGIQRPGDCRAGDERRNVVQAAGAAERGPLRADGVTMVDPEEGWLSCRDKAWGGWRRRRRFSRRLKGRWQRSRLRSVTLSRGTRLFIALPSTLFTAYRTRGPHSHHFRSDAAAPRSGAVSYECLQRADGASAGPSCGGCGHQVVIVTGPVDVEYPPQCEVMPVVSTEEMLAACQRIFPQCDGLIGVAAPCDYRPIKVEEQKIKKTGEPLVLHLVETPDIVATLGREQAARAMARRLRVGNGRSAFSGHHQNAEKKLRPDGSQRPASDQLGRKFGRSARSHRRSDGKYLRPKRPRRQGIISPDFRAVDSRVGLIWS